MLSTIYILLTALADERTPSASLSRSDLVRWPKCDMRTASPNVCFGERTDMAHRVFTEL